MIAARALEWDRLQARPPASTPPAPLVPPGDRADFRAWAREGGYDESYFNRWDGKSLALQEDYLEERSAREPAGEEVPVMPSKSRE